MPPTTTLSSPETELFPRPAGDSAIGRTPLAPALTQPVRVLTYGTFDLFHIGHLKLLQRLRALGDHLTVAVSTDEFNALKGKTSIVPYADRADIVANCRCVDAVIPEQSWDQKQKDVAKYAIDIFGMGDDWAGSFDELKEWCRVVYLPRTSGISSTGIKDCLIRTIHDSKLR